MTTQWWKNPDALSSDELTAKMTECTELANHHDENDRPCLARGARSKATIAGEALNRKGMKPLNTAADRMKASDRPSCDLCGTQHGTDADCDEDAIKRLDRRADRQERAARRKEMKQDMRDSYAR